MMKLKMGLVGSLTGSVVAFMYYINTFPKNSFAYKNPLYVLGQMLKGGYTHGILIVLSGLVPGLIIGIVFGIMLDQRMKKHEKSKVPVNNILDGNICPSCNTNNNPNNVFCGNCGSQLKQICPKCNTENKMICSFCTKCGTNLKSL